jgi:hypothetical protein
MRALFEARAGPPTAWLVTLKPAVLLAVQVVIGELLAVVPGLVDVEEEGLPRLVGRAEVLSKKSAASS